jgi:hypothetical protein
MKPITTFAVTALLALGAAAPANAKPTKYSGKTSAGDRISFTLSGNTLSKVRTFTPTVCVPTNGTPLAGTDFYAPPGRLRLGTTTKVQTAGPVDTAMHYYEVSKWFHFTAKRGKRGTITGTLHQNFSFETVGYSSWSGPSLLGWVCQGDAQFTARPR